MFGSNPRKGPGRVASWFWLRLTAGKPWRGWLAGPVIGVECHHLGGTRACPHVLTGGAIKCPVSHKDFPPEWKGYVPLWDENGTRCFVLIMRDWFEQIANVPLLGEVRAEKTTFHGAPIRVVPERWAKTDPPLNSHERRPQDIRPFLLRLWKARPLIDWFDENGMPALPAMAERVPVATLAERGAQEFFDRTKGARSVLKTTAHPNAESNGAAERNGVH